MVGLATRSPRPTLVPLEPFKNKVFKLRNKTPARGACREGRSRLEIIPSAQDPGKRSLLGRPKNSISEDMPWRIARPGKTRRATSFRARQDSDRGKELAAASFHRVPTLQLIWPRVTLGPFLGHVADGCAAWGTRWQAAVTRISPWRTETHGRTLFGATATGIQCLCPPPSRLGEDHCSCTVATTTDFTFLLSSTLTPVGDPFEL